MNGKELICTVKGHVATITMNRPDRYNALSIRMIEEFLEVISACEENPDVRAVILTGAGTAFCAGGDVKEFAERLEAISRHLRRLLTFFHGAISRMNRMSKPVIAAVNGVAAGAGMSLAMACDLAVAAESARFVMAYSKIGATPDGSSTYFLPRLVGLRRALELTYTNRALTAREAETWGLVNRVVPDAELPASVNALAAELAAGPTMAFGRAKRLFLMSEHESLETQMENETQLIAMSSKTADFREGVKAFAEKRRPIFRGE
ncbi:MAG: enoyl-CoA hydratase/isomerase family protein [Candidatus Methylomirabilis oxyfera]|nr:enoyl-CoA hydratase/isomerase family protein [Candidatus Methylomirabilis oxyfera]